jgi:predicted Zn finger-like uncharacterized protein
MAILTVDCPACETTFPVDPAKVPAGGVRARCSVCGGIFRVEDAGMQEPAPPPVATADRVGDAAFPGGGPDSDHGPEPWSGVGVEAPGTAIQEPPAFDALPDLEEGEEERSALDWEEEPQPSALEREEEIREEPGTDDGGWSIGSVDVAPGGEPDLDLRADEGDDGSAEALEPTRDPFGLDDLSGGQDLATEAEEPGALAGRGADALFLAGPAAVPPPPAPAPPAHEAPPLPRGFQFGRRDPHEKARRLARVLVSDIITYNPERYLRALENDSLREDFEDEIRKSWDEYVEQVGVELARDTEYWTTALNDLLARGRDVF